MLDSLKTAAAHLALEHEAVPAEQVVAGQPTTGLAELGTFAGSEYGVWEMSVGAMSDTEADEVFVVLSGAAVVEFLPDEAATDAAASDASDGVAPAAETLTLAAGDVVQLRAGQRTIWTVTETLRKVYITPA